MHTTFKQLREFNACAGSYRALGKHLGGIKKYGDTKPIPLSVGLESNSAEDVLWVVSNMELTPDQERDFRLFACGCAESVLPIYEKHYPGDDRVKNCIEVAKRYAVGKATEEERDAARAAGAAARDAAWDAAGAAGAARDAAWAAAGAAAGDAAGAAWAARAARDAAGKKQGKELLRILKRYEG